MKRYYVLRVTEGWRKSLYNLVVSENMVAIEEEIETYGTDFNFEIYERVLSDEQIIILESCLGENYFKIV